MVDLSIFNSLVPSQGMSEEAQRALLANALRMQQSASDTSPIRSPWQGAARLADGLFAGIANYRAASAAREQNKAWQDAVPGLLPPAQALAQALAAPAAPAQNALNPALASAAPTGGNIAGSISDLPGAGGPRADLTQPGPGTGGSISLTDPSLSAIPTGRDEDTRPIGNASGPAPAPGDYYSTTSGIENPSGNPQATSPTGATGQFQFKPSTWRQYGGGGNIHGDQQAAMTRLSQANNDQLTKSLGRPPTAGELYLAHQQGAAGAAKLINNPDSTPQQLGLGNAVGVQAGGKPFVNVPASQYVEHWTSQFDGVPNPFSGPTQLAGDIPSLGGVPMGSSPISGGGNVTPGGPGGGATPQPPPQGLLPVPFSGPYGAVASARGDTQSGAPLPGYQNIGSVAQMSPIADINMVPGFGGNARMAPSYVSGMGQPNANMAGMEASPTGATLPPQLALARALSNFSGGASPDSKIQLAGDIPTIGAVSAPSSGALTPQEIQGQQARDEALRAGAARTVGLQTGGQTPAPAAPTATVAGPAIVVPGYEKTGAVTRAQAEAAPEDSMTMPSTDEWDAAAARGGKPSGAPAGASSTPQVAPTAPAAAAPAPNAQQAPGAAPAGASAAQQGQGALGLAPEGSHYAQLPGPPLLLPGPGSGAAPGGSGGFGFGGLGDLLSHIFGFGGAPPFNAASGGAASPPGASQPQGGKQISGQLADQAGAGGQASPATQAAPQMYNGIAATQLKAAATIMMNQAAPAEYRALAKEVLQRALIPPAGKTQILTDDQLTKAERDAGGEWVVNELTGQREQVKGTEADATRAPNADERTRIIAAGGNPDLYQVKKGELEPIAPAKPVNSEIVKLDDGTWQTVDKATGKTIGAPIGQPSVRGGVMLANGVNKVDQDLSGEDFLGQFSPGAQAAIKGYVDGKTMPTGNPRSGYVQAIKEYAQKYGADIGMPVDDTTFAARRAMRNNLAVGAPNSLGGQRNAGNTAVGHLGTLSQDAADLNNYNLGFTPLGNLVNSMRSLEPVQAGKVSKLWDDALHYGQEIARFYGGGPSGEQERLAFLNKIGGSKTPEEMAGVIESEATKIPERMDNINGQIREVLGEGGATQYPGFRPETEQSFKTIAANLDRLHGRAPGGAPPGIQPTSSAPLPSQAGASAGAQPTAPVAPVRVTSPDEARKLPPGTPIILPDGSQGRVPGG